MRDRYRLAMTEWAGTLYRAGSFAARKTTSIELSHWRREDLPLQPPPGMGGSHRVRTTSDRCVQEERTRQTPPWLPVDVVMAVPSRSSLEC
jgi:hypothetical protein